MEHKLSLPRQGYWSDHEYRRASVLNLEQFVGWPKLISMCEAGGSDRDKALPAIMFQTGGRVSEILQYSSKNFQVDGDFVICKDLPLVKQKKIIPKRTCTFPINEPLWKYSSKWIELRRHKPVLFSHHRSWAYAKVVDLGKKVGLTVWDHWFRSQRASQLAEEYGIKGADLREWFKVRDITWDSRYGKIGVRGLQALIQKNRGK